MKVLTFSLLPLFGILALLGGCKPRMGYGVILWSSDSTLPNGEIVTIESESIVRDTYAVKAINNKKSAEVKKGHIAFFTKKNEALEYVKLFDEFKDTFGENRNPGGLYIREKATTASKSLYRLHPEETVKLLSRSKTEVEIGQFTGRWCEVLTKNGVRGFVYDYYLRLYKQTDDAVEVIKSVGKKSNEKEILAIIYSGNWRTEAIKEFVDGKYTLPTMINENYGFYVSAEPKRIAYKSPLFDRDEEYTQATYLGDNIFDFGESGFQITVYDNNQLSLRFPSENQDVIRRVYNINQSEFEDAIQRDSKRKESLFEEFIKRGNIFTAVSSFGTIFIDSQRRFRWEQSDRLIARGLLDASAMQQGRIDFPYRIAFSLTRKYNGIISFYFDGADDAISFLYAFDDNENIRLIYVTPSSVKEGIVRSDIYLTDLRINFSIDKSSE